MSFQDLKIDVRYRSDENNFVRDFIYPVLKNTILYKRAVGYFSTSSLVKLTDGLFDLASRGGKVQLVCSPYLSEEDITAVELGYKKRDEVIINNLSNALIDPITVFEEERLNLVATMIANGTLDLKLAFMETFTGKNVYHEKIAIFEDSIGNIITHTGSMNESSNALEDNFESIYTFCSWKDDSQKDAVNKTISDFRRLWDNQTAKLQVVPFPKIVIDKLLRYKKETVDYTTDRRQFFIKDVTGSVLFRIPESVSLRDYQSKAINNWFKQGCQGIFDMCTGSGKTYTSLACMVNLAKNKNDTLAVFIVCPFIHLVSQWEEDVIEWGISPIICHSKSPQDDWEKRLRRAYKRFKKEGKPFICLTTNDTFSSERIQSVVTSFTKDDNVLLIVDEAHNFGADKLSQIMPENISNRIALSATIKRYMDRTGTDRLFGYFGEKCIEYGLEDAIRDGALVPYKYYPVLVSLEQDERDKYFKITKQLRNYLIEKNNKITISEAGKPLVFKRNRILAGARAKIPMLMSLMEPYKNLGNILVYCGAALSEDADSGKVDRQIDLVTNKLRGDLSMSVQRFTAEENLNERQAIKKYFITGQYQVITAIKCLDEGVNIPGIETAFILSSTRNPKEFVQRRGRLLRRSPGKEVATIYDFITLPKPLDDISNEDLESDRSLVLGELARINEFGKLALNSGDAEIMKNRIMEAYGEYFDIEAEIEEMEDRYAE